MKEGIRKGILLAGGSGSRWYPTSLACSKHLFPVYDKPMIYYPLATLIECGIDEILIIGNNSDLPAFKSLFGNGSKIGLNIQYKIQPKPEGIAQAITIGSDFIDQSNFALILGDNLFSNNRTLQKSFVEFQSGGHVFVSSVDHPEQFGILDLDANGSIRSITEKPQNSKSNLAVVGLYLYDADAIQMVRELQPSGRGEYEISDLNSAYLHANKLTYSDISSGDNWFDCGGPSSIQLASDMVMNQQGDTYPIGAIEAASYLAGRISRDQFEENIQRMPDSVYSRTLTNWLSQNVQ